MSTNLTTPPASHNWYAIHTLIGYETRVAEALRQRAAAAGLEHRIGRILVPTEEVTEMRGGQSVARTRAISPGLVFAEMDLNDDLFNLVKGTPKVTGFVGGPHPTPLSQTEVESILKARPPVRDRPVRIRFEVGDEVRVVDGAFAGFAGTVASVDPAGGKLQVSVKVFDRSMLVQLELRQVEER